MRFVLINIRAKMMLFQFHFRFTPVALYVRLALAAGIGVGAIHARAADLEDTEGDVPQAGAATPAVVITGHGEDKGYLVKRTTSATRTDTPLRDVPQTITVVTENLIKDQAMQGMADVARYVPGISMANGEGNRDSPIFRGSSSASGDFYIDGVRDDVEYYRDLYNVEQVEALTGPNAMIFGRGGTGGVINRVLKRADGRTVRAADLTLGSYQQARLTADVGQAVNDVLAVRVTAMYEDSNGHQRNFNVTRSGINPTLAIRPGKDMNIVLGLEHFEDKRPTDRGVPSLDGRPLELPVDAFFGDADPATRPTRVVSDAFSAVVEHDFGGGVHLANKTRYTDYDKFYQNYNSGALNTRTDTVPISAYNNHQWRKNLFNQTDVTLAVDSGAVRHVILAGMELGRQDTDYLRMTGLFANNATSVSVPLANPDGALPVRYVLGGSSADRDGSSKAKIAALYAQDQVQLTPQWQLIAGLRVDSFQLDYHNKRAGGLLAIPAGPADLASDDTLVSPRLGLVYKPVEPVSLYANYSVASFPRGGDQLASLSSVNQGLKPEKFINVELGAKWEITPALMATAAVYRLDRNNVAVVDPVTGIADRLVDGQRTNGVELGVSGNIARNWSVQGGYAHQDSKLLATASSTALAGARIGNVPKNTFSLWNRYDVTRTVGAGLGVIYRDDMFASTSNTVTLPGYTRVDAALFLAVNPNVKVQMNVENLLDKRYYAFANGDNNITPGSPRAVRVAVRGNF